MNPCFHGVLPFDSLRSLGASPRPLRLASPLELAFARSGRISTRGAKESLYRVLRTVLLAGALAVIVSTVSHFLAPHYASRSFVADQQLAILERRPFVEPGGRAGDVPEFRNRILVPAALAATIAVTRLSPVMAYFTVRVACAFAMWFCAGDPPARRAAYAALLAIVAMGVTIGTRMIFHLPGASIFNSIAIQGSVGSITRTFVTDPGPRIWIIGLGVMAVVPYYWLETARGWTSSDPRAIKAAAVILVLTLVFGVIRDLRIYMPVITCVLLAGVSPHALRVVIAGRASAGSTALATTPQSASR
jgi:hypothetical protein